MRLKNTNVHKSEITAAFYEEFGETNPELPEIKMWKMVLHRAIWDYKHFWELRTLEKRFYAKQAQLWIRKHGPVESPRVGSCAWVCLTCFPEFYPQCLGQLVEEVRRELPSTDTVKSHRAQEYIRLKTKRLPFVGT